MYRTDMLFRIYSLQPQIFDSFFATSLIARGLDQGVFSQKIINWRDEFGVGNYKQVDDRPYGGSHGMVIQADPIIRAMEEEHVVSEFFAPSKEITTHTKVLPNNHLFYDAVEKRKEAGLPTRNATILLSPRGYPMTQQVAEWLATSVDEITLLCGRYEGFDARVNEAVDMEISLGNFVLNGGEVAAMAMVESVARLLPGFLVKEQTAEHDSFSTDRLIHRESMEYILGKKRMEQSERVTKEYLATTPRGKLFDTLWWKENILPQIEYPQYTRPETWNNWKVPEVLTNGDHKKIDDWRRNWWKEK